MARKKLKEIARLNSKQNNPDSPNDFFQEQFIVCSLAGSPKAMKNPKHERLLIINGPTVYTQVDPERVSSQKRWIQTDKVRELK